MRLRFASFDFDTVFVFQTVAKARSALLRYSLRRGQQADPQTTLSAPELNFGFVFDLSRSLTTIG